MPYFVIDFAGPDWAWLTFDAINGSFVSGERFIPGVKSIHFTSNKDPLFPWLKNLRNFENGLLIEYE